MKKSVYMNALWVTEPILIILIFYISNKYNVKKFMYNLFSKRKDIEYVKP